MIKSDLKNITVRLDDHLGDTVIATAPLQALRRAYPKARIAVYSNNPELLRGLRAVDAVHRADIVPAPHGGFTVDVRGYVKKRNPQNVPPFEHLAVHQQRVFEQALGHALPSGFLPKIDFTWRELDAAAALATDLSAGKPLILIQTLTSEAHKNWDDDNWRQLREGLPDCAFADLSSAGYPARVSAALTKFAVAVVTLDTFALHAAKAAGTSNVIGIMVSSQPTVVGYEGQTILGRPGQAVTAAMVAGEIEKMLPGNAFDGPVRRAKAVRDGLHKPGFE